MPERTTALSPANDRTPVPEDDTDPALTHPWGAEFVDLPRSDRPSTNDAHPDEQDMGPLIGERRHHDSFGVS